MTARCEITGLVLGQCAERCCRPDLAAYQPIPEVWMRVTEPAGRPVVPSPSDVAEGNVHALFQVVSGRTSRPDVVEMVREMCETSAHVVRYGDGQVVKPATAQRKSKGKRRRSKAGRSAGKAPKYHTTVEPPLLIQLYESVEPSSSAEAGVSRPASSRPAARLDAIDTANRIDQRVSAWLTHLEIPAAGHDSIGRLRYLASLLPSLDTSDAQVLKSDIARWWKWARVVTGWDTPAWQPDNTCPLCGTRGSLRIRFEDQLATCVNDACRETWDSFTIGLLAAHIRTENNDTEGAS